MCGMRTPLRVLDAKSGGSDLRFDAEQRLRPATSKALTSTSWLPLSKAQRRLSTRSWRPYSGVGKREFAASWSGGVAAARQVLRLSFGAGSLMALRVTPPTVND